MTLLQSIRFALDTHMEADLLNLKQIQQGGLPVGLLKTDQGLTAEQSKQLRAQWDRLYGGPGNAGRVAVLPNKMEFQELSRTPADMQFHEGKRLNREEILANYGVGPEILGLTESQTRANAEASIFVFLKFGVTPFLDKFIDTLNNDYLPAFPGTEGLEFYYDDPVPENMEEKRKNLELLAQHGGLTPDEMRTMLLGLDPLNIAGVTDVPYLPFSMVPAGEEPPPKDLPLP